MPVTNPVFKHVGPHRTNCDSEAWYISRRYEELNLLWSTDAIWWYRSESTLAQIMACCLTLPSHYLNLCRHEVLNVSICKTSLNTVLCKSTVKYPRIQIVTVQSCLKPSYDLTVNLTWFNLVIGLIDTLHNIYLCLSPYNVVFAH